MNAPHEPAGAVAPADAVDRNQRWLVDQVSALRERLRTRWSDDGAAASTAPVGTPAAFPTDGDDVPQLERITRLFGLSRFERELLLLAAGFELDRGLRELLRQPPSFSLALAALPEPHWDAIAPQNPLRYWRLLELPPDGALLEAPLRVDERILHCLTGVAAVDEQLFGVASFRPPDRHEHEAIDRAAAALASAGLDRRRVPLVWIEGAATGAELRSIAIGAAHRAGRPALVMSVADVPDEARARAELARRLDREAALSGGLIVLAASGTDPAGEPMQRVLAFVDALETPLLLSGRFDGAALQSVAGRARIRIAVSLAAIDAGDVVRRRAARHGADTEQALRRAASQFRVPGHVVDECLDRVAADDSTPVGDQLWQGLREASRGGLDELAQRIDSRTGLADLVLPVAQLEQLEELAAQLRNRHTVYDDWGFAARGSRGLGIAALFAGESGTGKTMAAEAVANHVGLDLFRIDLAHTVSKYIGETEKNLARIFDAAEASGAVLLFDEADALFGKRSDVKDSHDRYANIEVAYLLQRIEAYRGLAILTTNLKSSLDRAFQRRIRFVVNFPFPDVPARSLLWRRQWPERAPIATLDFDALARMPLAGGHIRSVALNAAFMAAEAGQPIDMAHVRRAAQREAAKLERTLLDGVAAPAGKRP